MADISVVVGQFLCLGLDCGRNLLTAIADVDAVEPRKGVDEFIPAAVHDTNARPAVDDARRGDPSGVILKVRRGMKYGFSIDLF